MKFYLNNKLINEENIPLEAIEVTTYGDLFEKIRRFICSESNT